MQLLIDLLTLLTPYGTYSYWVMFGILLACGFGLPMPEDIILISGGILSARGITNVTTVNLICMAGVLIGDGTIFFIGRKFGQSIKSHRFFRRIVSEKNDQRVAAIVKKYGDKVIFMARFMPGLRTPTFLTCGTYQVKPWKFFLFDGFAALISVPVWIHVGYLFGQNLEELEKLVRKMQAGIYITLALVIIAFVLFKLIKKKSIEKMEANQG
jgi:membrane protein DedA with SNARE-associated domain